MHTQFHLDSLRMWFRPNESCIDQLHLLQSLQTLQANRQQLFGFQTALHPLAGWIQIALAVAAEEYHRLFGYVGRDIDVCPQAGHAHIRRIRFDGNSALAAKTAKRTKVMFTIARFDVSVGSK